MPHSRFSQINRFQISNTITANYHMNLVFHSEPFFSILYATAHSVYPRLYMCGVQTDCGQICLYKVTSPTRFAKQSNRSLPISRGVFCKRRKCAARSLACALLLQSISIMTPNEHNASQSVSKHICM